ncbi:lantibiotic dehydratase [Halosaccharopolyspora lacisalsi]|uniref:lantibiotic dehydratase n=1 Tax=Halosaccharopolyspora lacisalsi TaxID=1000566 RepID=UPI0015FBE783
MTSLVQHGFLVTSLRAPSTVTDPSGHVLDRLRETNVEALPVAPLIRQLDQVHRDIDAHNEAPSEHARDEYAGLAGPGHDPRA